MIDRSGHRHAHTRRPMVRAAALIGVFATGIWFGAAGVRAYDPRLDEALAALQKAAALVFQKNRRTVGVLEAKP